MNYKNNIEKSKYFDSFISKDLKQLSAFENNIKLEFLSVYFIKS